MIHRYTTPLRFFEPNMQPPEDPPHRLPCETCESTFDPQIEDFCSMCGPTCEACSTIGFDVESDGGTMINLGDDGWWCSFCDAKYREEEGE